MNDAMELSPRNPVTTPTTPTNLTAQSSPNPQHSRTTSAVPTPPHGDQTAWDGRTSWDDQTSWQTPDYKVIETALEVTAYSLNAR